MGIDIYFHFAPLKWELVAENLIITREEGTNLAFYLLCEGWQMIEETGWVAYSYGEKIKAPVLRFKKEGELPLAFEALFYPFTGELDRIKLDNLMREFYRESTFIDRR